MLRPNVGLPKFGTASTARNRIVSADGKMGPYVPGGGIIDGTKTRNPFNTDLSASDSTPFRDLWPGLLMGRITSSGKWANSCIGKSTAAITTSGTTLAIGPYEATELVRRVGSTGTFKLTGPPSAAGTVRTVTVTYSAVNTSTGDVTVTAIGVNEVQTVNLVTAGTGGNLRLLVPKPDGTMALTPNIAWSATDATLLASANTALDTATGVSGGLVASAISATDTDLGFKVTFAGTGYAGLTGPTTGGSWPLIVVDTLFTSNTGANVVRTTSGVSGAFVSGSLVQPTDGSETILSFIPDSWGEYIDEAGSDQPFPRIPAGGFITDSQLVPWPADASLKTYIQTALKAVGTYQFTVPLNG